MTITVSTTDPRSIKAPTVLETAPTWLKVRRKDNGAKFYVVPGSDGRLYWTNQSECSCPDAQHRGIACKHQLAVRLHVARVLASRQARRLRLSTPEANKILFGYDDEGAS